MNLAGTDGELDTNLGIREQPATLAEIRRLGREGPLLNTQETFSLDSLNFRRHIENRLQRVARSKRVQLPRLVHVIRIFTLCLGTCRKISPNVGVGRDDRSNRGLVSRRQRIV